MNISDLSTEALKEELRRREVRPGAPARHQQSASLSAGIEESSDDDSLYRDPRGVALQLKKRHRSRSPDPLDDNENVRSARRSATNGKGWNETHVRDTKTERTKVVVTQEERDFILAIKLQADENSVFVNSRKQWTDPRFGTESHPIDLDRTSSPFQDYAAAIRDYDPQDAAIARQLHQEELQAQEERLREAASHTRDCAVCGEATLIIELPSSTLR